MSKKENIEKAKLKLIELSKERKEDVFPNFIKDDQINVLLGFIKLINKPIKPEYNPNLEIYNDDEDKNNETYLKYIDENKKYESDLILYEKLKEIVDLVTVDGFYDKLIDFGFGSWENYKKRFKMNYIYKTQIGVNDLEGKETKFNLYDMSMLKFGVETGKYDLKYFKEIPDWNKDINSFTDLMIPFNCSTVYLFNPNQNSVLDLRKEELRLINFD